MKNFLKEVVKHFQSGVSYIIPLVTAAGLLTSIAVIFGGTDVWNHTSNIWGNIRYIGQTGLGFIVPMISAYIAYSIADRPALAPAFIGGLIAADIGTGFLGGMVSGVVVGYLVQELKKLPVPTSIISLKSLIIIPFIATLVVGLLLVYVVGTPVASMTVAITSWLEGMSGTNAVILAVIIGAMMASDMGGPINKVAYTFGVASYASGAYAVSTAVLMAIAIPNAGMFLATVLGKKYFSEEEIDNGKSAIIMGAVGITEGTIPFAVSDPLRVIPSIIVGTAVGCGLNAAFGVTHETMLATFMAIPFTSNGLLYTLAVLVGSLTTAGLVILLKSMKKVD